MFHNLLTITLFVICTIESGLAIRCYSCADCNKGVITEQICPVETPNCGKVALIADMSGNHAETVSKGCFPDRRDLTCQAFMMEGMKMSGVFTQQMLDFIKQTLQRPDVRVTCDFCRDRDLCNSSTVILPSLTAFLMLAILAKLF